jgi:hypothetical protein
MSIMILSPKHFATVEECFVKVITTEPLFNKSFLPKYGIDIDKGCQKTAAEKTVEIFEGLKELNVLSYMFKYEKGVPNFDEEIQIQLNYLRTETTPADVSIVGFYNACRCLLYQIEKEEIEGIRNDLFINIEFLTELTDALAHFIIAKLPEDASNYWCID